MQQQSQEQPYYTLDIGLFEGIFRYFGSEPVQVRGKIHEETERYSSDKTELDIEPVSIRAGMRTYLHLKPYVLIPDIRLTVGLYSQPRPTGAIGEVIASREQPRMKEIEIGQVQAWSYPDGTVTIWECFLEQFVRDRTLGEDENMRCLWTGCESFLREHFPSVQRIVTPFDEPLFEREEYQQFLRTLGYRPVAKAAFGKEIARDLPQW
jgi:hypothetical protein